MIDIGYKKIRSPSNYRKSVDISYIMDNKNQEMQSKFVASNNSSNYNNMSAIISPGNSALSANNSMIRSASQKSYLLRNYGYSPIYKKEILKESKLTESPPLMNQNKKMNFSRIGIDVLNSNRVMMNFNKKNYLGSGYYYRHVRSDSQKSTLKQNNIIIKEPDVKENLPVTNTNIQNSSVVPENNFEEKNNNSTNLSMSKDIRINNSLSNSNLSLINEKSNYNNNSKKRIKLCNDNLKLNLLNKISDENMNLDNCVNFLRDLNSDGCENKSFVNHLKLFESFLEIEFSLDNYGGITTSNSYFPPGAKRPNHLICLRRFFGILREEYFINKKNFQSCDFFLFETLNKLYQKSLKLQIILFAVFFVCSSHVILDSTVKANIKKLMISLVAPVINIFELFIYNQVLLNYSEIFSNELKVEFGEKYTKVYKNYKMSKTGKLSDMINVLNKNLENLSLNIKQFSGTVFKFSQMKPFHNAIFDILKDFEKYSVNNLANLILGNILFCHLENNFNKNRRKIKEDPIKDESNLNFLPPIDNKYIYTLVLDLDETLIHFFYTQIAGGLFFIRPYALEFLKGLCDIYEIVIFTAATKDYADDILDKLDPDGLYIQHRLYRQHTSNVGLHIIKDLSKLGRDLSKVIIVDNIAENFKLQINNGFMIKTWNDNFSDTQLEEFYKILKDIYVLRVSDVRTVIKKIKDDIPNLKSFQNVDVAVYI